MSNTINTTIYNKKLYKLYPVDAIQHFIGWAYGKINSQLEASRVRMHLETFSDRELADIGINRGQINSVANGTLVRK